MKRTKTDKKRRINGWKISFFLLLGLIVGSLLFFYFRLTAVREPAYQKQAETALVKNKKAEPTFQLALKKSQVNQIIDYYLNDFLKGSGGKYNFYLEDQALLNGSFKVLGHKVQFYLYFDPYVMENGDVQLRARSLSIGTLSLPISQIMGYVSNNFHLPKWVEVNKKKETITLHLSKYRLKNGMYIKADKINLIDDDIRFNVYLPMK